MATLRLNLDQIETEILHITGYSASTTAPWTTQANLYRKINFNAQKIAQKVAIASRAMGKDFEGIGMWNTTATATTSSGVGNFVIVAGSSALLFPDDLDTILTLHDTTNDREVPPIVNKGQKAYRQLRARSAGPAEAYELTDTTGVRRNGRLLPDTASAVEPPLRLHYYRTPAIMPGSDGSSEFPDADNKWHYLWVLETVLEVLRPDDAAYERYEKLENSMINELAEVSD